MLPALACCCLFLLAGLTGATTPKRVLIVHSFGNAAPPFTTHSIAFETELAKTMGEPVDLDEVSLDVARYATLDMEEALVDLLRKRQEKWQPDLVVPIGSPAGIFVANHRDRLFPATTPIIYAGMDQRRLPAGALDLNATFVGESFDVRHWVEDILHIAPDTKNIAVLIGASPLERIWSEVLRKEFQPFEDRVKFTFLNDLSLDGILQRTSTLPPRSFIFVVLFMKDASGVTHNGDEVLQQIHAVANAPINGIYQHQLGIGIVGGRLYQAEAEGVEAARIAVRILRGESASSFPPTIIGPLPPRYDWRELQKWKIDEKSLPPGSTILFRAPTFWQQHRGLIVGVVSVGVAQAMLIIALLAQRGRRRRAEITARESESRMSLAVSSAKVGLWNWDIKKNEIWVSAEFRDLLGFTADEPVTHEDFYRLVHPEDRKRRADAIDQVLENGSDYQIEYRILRSDGSLRWVNSQGRCQCDGDGKTNRILGAIADITQRRETELETQQHHRELAHVARVSILGELSASLAHELNQPLTAILANSRAAQRYMAADKLDPDELREILKDITFDTMRARDVILHVRALVKKSEQEFGDFDVAETIRKVVTFLHGDIVARNGRVELELTPDLPPVHGDVIQLQQVILNLILNAFDAMEDLPFPQRQVTFSARLEPPNKVRISVRDGGLGIPPEKLEMIFEPFYTTKANGMGMGLSVTRTIIDSHGGRIWAENLDGAGAVFHVVLPSAGRT